MTKEEALQLLNSVAFAPQGIAALMESLERARSAAERCTVDFDTERVQSSPDTDRMADNVARIVAIEQRIFAWISEASEKELAVIDGLGKIQNKNARDALYFRYVAAKSPCEVAEKLGYSGRQARRLLNSGLEEFMKVCSYSAKPCLRDKKSPHFSDNGRAFCAIVQSEKR